MWPVAWFICLPVDGRLYPDILEFVSEYISQSFLAPPKRAWPASPVCVYMIFFDKSGFSGHHKIAHVL